jgi:hypothetical protein
MAEINFGDWLNGKKFTAQVESDTPEEAAARREEILEEGKHRRRIHFWLIIFAIVLVLISFLTCGYVLLTGSPNDKVWASGITSLIVSGLCGGLFGAELGKRGG